jgi:type II secretory pathway component GspD/PulD (secretin)
MPRSHFATIALLVLLFVPLAAAPDESGACSEHWEITLDVENEDVLDVLKEIASQARVNVAVTPEIRGRVSATFLCLDVREALAYVLGQVNATYCHDGRVFRIDSRVGNRERCPNPQPILQRTREES